LRTRRSTLASPQDGTTHDTSTTPLDASTPACFDPNNSLLVATIDRLDLDHHTNGRFDPTITTHQRPARPHHHHNAPSIQLLHDLNRCVR